MPALTPEQIQEIASKYFDGSITPAEKKLLDEWYNTQPTDTVEWKRDEAEAALEQRLFTNIQEQISSVQELPVVLMRTKRRILWRVAAAVLAGITVTYFYLRTATVENDTVAVKNTHDTAVTYTRYLTLEDGSTVILHADSKLTRSPGFNNGARVVTLTGEAYFDITRDTLKPFIIHTGKVKTTVLGTAFNISAYPGKNTITVAVTRGKVRVEDSEKILAELTPDQQVVYNIPTANAEREKVNAVASSAGWVRQDMNFDGASLASVVQVLNKRYNVNISFKNHALENCKVKVSFNGTEPLVKVLDLLCTISNASYTKPDDANIVIDGEGCM
ncbi:FecR family protein [Foetidibacter luteolus]|uniref:FecR family protein n=1 Tax=Foetidibacter luteolus TaxID=2608880 RepID=UPI00129A77F8|nr:FecR family protein [Foetidibacter luteolus]